MRSGALVTLAAIVATACVGRPVRTAPFRERPDSVAAGDLRGPFDGRVVDAASGSPIAGAMVYATWTLQAGYGVGAAAGFREYVTSTDAAGRYTIPSFAKVPPPREAPDDDKARLTDFYLVVYKRGFVGYRSDRRFADMGRRGEFAQKQNEIELERWREDYSHARHLRYLGGGAALASVTAWEVDEAAEELAGGGTAGRIATDLIPRRGTGAVVAAQLISEGEIKDITKYDGAFETGPLGDDPDTGAYSSQHFKALGRPQTFDVAVRMWQLDPGDAQTRYGALIDTLPNVDERNEIANRSLRAREKEIHGAAFLDGQRGIVVLVTCGESQCATSEMAVEMATIMYEKIQRLIPAPAGDAQ